MLILLVLFLIAFVVVNTTKVSFERWGATPSFIMHLLVAGFINALL